MKRGRQVSRSKGASEEMRRIRQCEVGAKKQKKVRDSELSGGLHDYQI
jgi:hypothetical protein